jgi:hypothetical protein
MPPAGFEPAIPASERPQTHALDSAATGIGLLELKPYKFVDVLQVMFTHCPIFSKHDHGKLEKKL